jgi:hypothetical protein
MPKETKYSIAKQYGITIEATSANLIALTNSYQLLIKGTAPKHNNHATQKKRYISSN